MKTHTIIYIEDERSLFENLHQTLQQSRDFECLSGFDNAEDALRGMEQGVADIYLVDLGLPGISGLEFIAKARELAPQSDFVVYTISESGKDLLDALAIGAVGYLVKGCSNEELIAGLNIVANGGGLITPRMARKLSHHFQAIGTQKNTLTMSEQQVLSLLKMGKTYAQIAEQNHVSISTIQTHVKHIYRKLNVTNRDDAVRTGVLFGLLEEQRKTDGKTV